MPMRQASTTISLVGIGFGNTETPFQTDAKSVSQSRSLRMDALIFILMRSGPLSSSNRRATKSLAGRTHFAMCSNLPSRDCKFRRVIKRRGLREFIISMV